MHVTVCIAAMCDNGERVVAVTDTGITFHPISADIPIYKAKWVRVGHRDWMFLFAGEPGQADLIVEEFIAAIGRRPSRHAVEDTLRRAYKKRYADWIAERILFPWDFDLATFKRRGRKLLGDALFEQLLRDIEGAESLSHSPHSGRAANNHSPNAQLRSYARRNLRRR